MVSVIITLIIAISVLGTLFLVKNSIIEIHKLKHQSVDDKELTDIKKTVQELRSEVNALTLPLGLKVK